MADDDLLMPGVLRLYHETLTAEPHIDIIYGNLQLDRQRTRPQYFCPNDWTGRPSHRGAKLYGSCVPDGALQIDARCTARLGLGLR